jgi:Domain of unknown function (DUF4333)
MPDRLVRQCSTDEDPMQRLPGPTAVIVIRSMIGAMVLAGPTGCGSPAVDDARIVATLRAELERQGVQADDLTCPDDLPAQSGRSVRCTFTVDGQPVDAVATVAAVNGETVTYDVRTQARPVTREVLERTVAEQLARMGAAGYTAACAGDLPAKVGATIGCTLTAPDGSAGIAGWTVRTTAVDGGKVDYAIEQVAPT